MLLVQLREPTTDNVVLDVTAVRTAAAGADAAWQDWQAPRLEPLDVVGQVAVVGLLLDDRLKVQSLEAADLIAIDTKVLDAAMPATAGQPASGASASRPVAAYYAPQGQFRLSGKFAERPATLAATTSLLLTLADQRQEIDGGFTLTPEGERRFAVDFAVPAGWHVDRVAAGDGQPLGFERYADDADKSAGRIHVRLPRGIAPGQEFSLRFHAVRTPPGWLGTWEDGRTAVEFPAFAVLGADRDVGALAVETRDDLAVQHRQPAERHAAGRQGEAGLSLRNVPPREAGVPLAAGGRADQAARDRPELSRSSRSRPRRCASTRK